MFKIWSEPEKTFIRNLKWSLVYEFPQYTFDKIVQFFSTILSPFKPSVMTALKKIIYFSLPFIGLHSLQIRYEITGLRNAAFLHLDVRLIFKSLHFQFQKLHSGTLGPIIAYSFFSSVNAVSHRMWVKLQVISSPNIVTRHVISSPHHLSSSEMTRNFSIVV